MDWCRILGIFLSYGSCVRGRHSDLSPGLEHAICAGCVATLAGRNVCALGLYVGVKCIGTEETDCCAIVGILLCVDTDGAARLFSLSRTTFCICAMVFAI